MAENTWWTYVSRVTQSASGTEVAALSGVDAGAVSRWKSGRSSASAEAAVRLARSVGRPPVEALIAAGFLDPKEVDEIIYVPRPVEGMTDEELLDEVRRRMSTRPPEPR